MAQTPGSVLRLREEELSWREIDGEVVILDLRTSRYLNANPVGRLIWQRLANGGATRAELYDAVTENFTVDRPIAERDVDDFVDDLAGRGLLQ
jgi:hypothetical protein